MGDAMRDELRGMQPEALVAILATEVEGLTAEIERLREAVVFANSFGDTPPDEMEWVRCRMRFDDALNQEQGER